MIVSYTHEVTIMMCITFQCVCDTLHKFFIIGQSKISKLLMEMIRDLLSLRNHTTTLYVIIRDQLVGKG